MTVWSLRSVISLPAWSLHVSFMSICFLPHADTYLIEHANLFFYFKYIQSSLVLKSTYSRLSYLLRIGYIEYVLGFA